MPAARVPSSPLQTGDVFFVLEREQVHVVLLALVAPVPELVGQYSQHEDAAADLQQEAGEHILQLKDVHALHSLLCDVLGGLAFLALRALLVSEDPHQGFLDVAGALQGFPCCALVDPVIPHQLLHVVVVDSVQFLGPFPLLQAAAEYLVQERALVLEVPQILLIVVLSRSPLGEEQFLIDDFPEDLSNALLDVVDYDGVLDLAN